MKKVVWSVVLFGLVFALVYLALCYLVPGLRIKLSAPPAEYFRASVGHMVWFKGAISLVAGLLAAALPWLRKKA